LKVPRFVYCDMYRRKLCTQFIPLTMTLDLTTLY